MQPKKLESLSYLLLFFFSLIPLHSMGMCKVICIRISCSPTDPAWVYPLSNCSLTPIIPKQQQPASLQKSCIQRLLKDDVTENFLDDKLTAATSRENFPESLIYSLAIESAKKNIKAKFNIIKLYLSQLDLMNISFEIATNSLNHALVNIELIEMLQDCKQLNDEQKQAITLYKRFYSPNIQPFTFLQQAAEDSEISYQVVEFLLQKRIEPREILIEKLLEDQDDNKEKKLNLIIHACIDSKSRTIQSEISVN